MRSVAKNIFITVIVLTGIIFTSGVHDLFAYRESLYVPRVDYLNPQNGAVIEIGPRGSVTFSWKMVPIPGGGRHSYRFTLYKAEGYDVVESAVLGPDTYSFDVPAGKFEPGQRYRWQVKQRDTQTMQWSEYDNWYFKVAESAK